MTPGSYWRDEALCRLEDARLFDDVDSDRDNARARILTAIRICDRCPVATRCLKEARTDRDSGVRGGLLLEDGKPRHLPSGRGYSTRCGRVSR